MDLPQKKRVRNRVKQRENRKKHCEENDIDLERDFPHLSEETKEKEKENDVTNCRFFFENGLCKKPNCPNSHCDLGDDALLEIYNKLNRRVISLCYYDKQFIADDYDIQTCKNHRNHPKILNSHYFEKIIMNLAKGNEITNLKPYDDIDNYGNSLHETKLWIHYNTTVTVQEDCQKICTIFPNGFIYTQQYQNDFSIEKEMTIHIAYLQINFSYYPRCDDELYDTFMFYVIGMDNEGNDLYLPEDDPDLPWKRTSMVFSFDNLSELIAFITDAVIDYGEYIKG